MSTLTVGAFGGGMSGASGNTVFVLNQGDVVVRDRIIPANPQTADQQANRMRFSRASSAWSELSEGQWGAWEAFARTLSRRDPRTGIWKAPQARGLFVACYSKLLALDNAAPPPEGPPANPFFGDNVSVGASPSSSGARVIAAGGGGVLFTASAPNGPGIVTELLLQPLASRARRAYADKYRSRAFLAFGPGELEAFVPAQPGWQACGYRFVNAQTGQETPIVPCGIVFVAG